MAGLDLEAPIGTWSRLDSGARAIFGRKEKQTEAPYVVAKIPSGRRFVDGRKHNRPRPFNRTERRLSLIATAMAVGREILVPKVG